MAMKLKFKLQTTSLVKEAPSQKGDNQTPGLTFVHIDSPTQIKEKATQRRIRRHVMKNIGRSRRRDTAYIPNKQQYAAIVSKPLPRSIPMYWGDVKVCPNFKRLFWAMDMVSEGLLALAVADPADEFRQRLEKGLDDGQRCSQTLVQVRPIDEMRQYTESLSLVRKSIMASESQASRYAVIGTIICLAVLDMRVRNHERWTMHMEGLRRIVQLGGGAEALNSCPPLRHSLFLADVLGSLVDGAQPRFPPLRRSSTLPCGVLPLSARKLMASLERSESISPLDKMAPGVIERALKSASQLAIFLNQVWSATRMHLDLMIPVCTIAYDVLSLPSFIYDGSFAGRKEDMSQTTPICAAAELIRTSVLALLSTVITTTADDNLFCARHRIGPVRQLLTQTEDGVWAGCMELKLWVLFIQTMMETGPARPWFLDQITHVMSLLELRSWDDFMSCVRQVIWIEKAAMKEMEQLRSDIERRLAANTYATL